MVVGSRQAEAGLLVNDRYSYDSMTAVYWKKKKKKQKKQKKKKINKQKHKKNSVKKANTI